MSTRNVTVTAKGWAKSMTILVNGAVATPLVVDQVIELVSTSGDLIPDDISKWLLFALAFVNILLRARTHQPIAGTPLQDKSKVIEVESPKPAG